MVKCYFKIVHLFRLRKKALHLLSIEADLWKNGKTPIQPGKTYTIIRSSMKTIDPVYESQLFRSLKNVDPTDENQMIPSMKAKESNPQKTKSSHPGKPFDRYPVFRVQSLNYLPNSLKSSNLNPTHWKPAPLPIALHPKYVAFTSKSVSLKLPLNPCPLSNLADRPRKRLKPEAKPEMFASPGRFPAFSIPHLRWPH